MRGREANRIRILDGAVAAATLGLPKSNGVIIAGSGKYHCWLTHPTRQLFLLFFYYQSGFIYQMEKLTLNRIWIDQNLLNLNVNGLTILKRKC